MSVDFAAALHGQGRALAELLRGADPETAVPTCPGWTLRQLGTHVGRGERWAMTIVAEQAQRPVDPRSVLDGKPPADPDGAAEWLAAGAGLLTEAVEKVGADTPVWTFLGPRPAAWWVRRRLHESLVHSADAALALGVPFEPAPELAADGVSEWLSMLAARPAGAQPGLADGASMHLHATDDGLGAAGEWMIRRDGDAIAWESGHAKGTVAVRGAAVDLLLVLLRRIPADDSRVQVLGDAGVLQTWLARTGF